MSSNSEQNCDEVQLAAEIEVLKNALADKHAQLLAMEAACLQESDRQVELEDSIIAWQDKYERLYESHKRVQKLNQNLEDKLLKLVDRNSGERAQLTSDVATLSVRLAQANYNIQSLKREIERYKTDISVAIQLLQCKPDSFVSPKLSSLPIEIQSKVATYMRLDTNSHSDSEGSTSGVGMATTNSYHVLPASDSPPPICPFPPTAMVYSMRGLDGPNQDGPATNGKQSSSREQITPQEATLVVPLGGSATAISTDSLLGDSRPMGQPPSGQNVVSPSVMAKFLEDELKSSDALLGTPIKHCDTCVCTHGPVGPTLGAGETRLHESGSLLLADLLGSEQKYYSVATQTLIKGETNNSLCLRCSSNLNSPSHNNSPYMMKLIKSSDSVISETKSSVSDYLTTPDKVSPTGGGAGGTNGSTLVAHCDAGSGAEVDASEPLSLLVSTKKDDLMHTKPPVCGGAVQMTTAATVNRSEGQASSQPKFSHDSPSYIIKDTDQMSHATPISSTGGNGALGQSGKYGTSASGSVGSGLYHTVGSTNSLWSRTSSKDPEKDGAKMFEIFNRNLIKTIKAENPKMSGPRICALRIQNGSSNILLDNLVDDSLENLDLKPPTPVMYTRRAKFLDEELLLDDDPSIGLNGAIKTTNLPTATSSGDSISPAGFGSKSLVTPSKSSQQTGAAGGTGEGGADGHGNFITGTINRVDEGGGGCDDGVASTNVGKQVCNMSTTTSPHSSDRLCTIGEEVSNLLINTKLGSAALPKPRLDINVNKLEGIDVTSKKSCTQSSSISSEIDIQESAILRRQQLSRVAEWVQNNSKLGNADPLSNTESDNEPTGGHTMTSDSLNNNATPGVGAGHGAHLPKASTRSSVLHHSSSKVGVGVGGCESKAPTVLSDMKVGRHSYGSSVVGSNLLNNNHNNGLNNSIGYGTATFAQHGSTNTSSKPSGVASVMHGYNNNLNNSLNISTSASGVDYNSNSTVTTGGSTLGAIRKVSNMHRTDSTLTECLMEEVNRLSVNDIDQVEQEDDSSSVDLAQMEYNVKQFLLKQNEWSTMHTRRQSLISSSASSVKGGGDGLRTEDRPVRDPCKGLFPGMAVAQQTVPSYHHHHGGVTGGQASITGNPAYGNSYKYPINPHRTETNL
uniref:Tight junction-associated protein 1 n=1 Tax=Anopheles farauti TaxID=69004 RepID=A0A182QK07_9DIPT